MFDAIKSWFGFGGNATADDTERWPLTQEKVRSAVPMPAFLPYLDPLQSVGETQEMRNAYRYMLSDPNVKAALFGKLFGVMGQDLTIKPADKTNKQDRIIADFVEWNLKHALEEGFPGLVWDILSGALMCGYSVCEKVWDEPEQIGKWRGKRPLRRVKAKDVDQDLVILIDAYKNIIGVKGLRYNAGTVWNPDEFLIYTHLGLFENPTGMSDLRAAYGSFWMLDTVMKLRGLLADKRTMPIIVGKYSQVTQQPKVEQALANLRYRNWMTAPKDVQFDTLDAAGKAAGDYDQFCQYLRENIFLAITGATLQAITGGAGTHRGSSIIHKDSADLFKWHLTAVITHLLNDRKKGLIKSIVDINFQGFSDYPMAVLSGVDDAELAESATLDQTLMSVLAPMGVTLDPEELAEKYGRRLIKAQPGAEQGMPAQASPGGGGGAQGGWLPYTRRDGKIAYRKKTQDGKFMYMAKPEKQG